MSKDNQDGFQNLNFTYQSESNMLRKSTELRHLLGLRRTVRDFSPDEVPEEILKNCILAASSSPSGANKQPYKFVIIKSQALKNKIKIAAEKEEELFYTQRGSADWLKDLKPFRTNQFKPYLNKAPYLIAIFAKLYEIENKKKEKYYYPIESTGIAIGSLINCLHMSGLATLTHTPSPINFLNKILGQPKHYRPMILLVTGYPQENTQVPKLQRKNFEQIAEIL